MKTLFHYFCLFLFCILMWIHESKAQDYKTIDSLQQKLNSGLTDSNAVNILNKLFWEYKNVYPDTARNYIKKAISLSKAIDYQYGLARAYNNYGNLFSNLSKYDSAFYYYFKSLDIFSANDEKKGIADVYNNLGIIHTYQGNYDTAISYYQKSLQIEKLLNNPRGMASSYSNIGVIYYYKGDLNHSLEFFLKSLAIEEKHNFYKGMSYSYNNIGELYFNMKEYEQALRYYRKSIEIKNKLGDRSGMAHSYYNLGIIYIEKNDLDSALIYHEKALEIRKDLGDKHGVSYSYDKLGQIYYLKCGFSKALKFYEKSLKISTGLGDKKGVAESNLGMGNVYLKTGEYEKSIACLSRAYNISRNIGNLLNIKSAAQGLSKAYKNIKNYRKAFDYYVLFKKMSDSILNEENTKKITQLQMQYEFDKKQRMQKLEQEKRALKNKAELKKQKILRNSFIFGFGLTLILVFFIYKNYKNKKAANQLLEKQNKEIEKQSDQLKEQNRIVNNQKEEIIDSIVYASRIQNALLTPKDYLDRVLPKYFILNKPRDIVSGDFYWVRKIEDQLVITVADCTGHGIPGAFMSLLGMAFLNEIISIPHKNGVLNAAGILERLREKVIKSLHQKFEISETNEGIDMSLIIIDLKTNILQYAGAMNPLIIISGNELAEYKADRMPIGIHQHQGNPFTNKEYQVQHGDILYLFTDGYIDQFGGSENQRFTKQRLKKMLLELHHLPVQEQQKLLDAGIEDWKGAKNDQIDDILIMGLRMEN